MWGKYNGIRWFFRKNRKKETPFEVKEKISQPTKLIKVDEDIHKDLKIYSVKDREKYKRNGWASNKRIFRKK